MVVYLIGGPPKCGKTTLAKMMSAERTVPWISADTLQNIVYAYTEKEKLPALFPHKFARGALNDDFYGAHSPEAIVQHYIEQGKTSYEAIRAVVETYLTDEDDFIIEGYQVTPEIVHTIVQQYGNKHIQSAFLVKFDTKKFIENIPRSTTPNDWILRKTKQKETFSKIAQMVAVYSRYFEQEAEKYSLSVFPMDTDFEDSLKNVMHSME